MFRVNGPGNWPMGERFRSDLGDNETYPELPASVGLLPGGILKAVRRILLTFAKYKPNLGYTQGDLGVLLEGIYAPNLRYLREPYI